MIVYRTKFSNIQDLYENLQNDPEVPRKQPPMHQIVSTYYDRQGNYIPVKESWTRPLQWQEDSDVLVVFHGWIMDCYQFFRESEGMQLIYAPIDDTLPDIFPSKRAKPGWTKLHYQIGLMHGSCVNCSDNKVEASELNGKIRDIDPIFLVKAWCLYYNTYKTIADRPAGDKLDQFIKGLNLHYDTSSLGKVVADYANDYALTFRAEDGTLTEATLDELASRLSMKIPAKASGEHA